MADWDWESWDSNYRSQSLSTMGDWDSDYRYEPNPLFEQTFRCLPFTKYKNPHLETGNKIIMPPSSLDQIVNSQLKWPLIFKMEGFKSDKISHCGVLEFEAEEGTVYMPEWMMKNLNLLEGDLVILRDASLSKGMFMKLQPHATSFVELADPRAVLESTLRGFSCLSCGDRIMIKYGEIDFYIDVLDVGPVGAVTLIDTDCTVEFAPPLDYKEPERRKEKVDEREEEENVFRPFTGRGRQLDGEAMATGGGGCSTVVMEEVGGEEKGMEKFKAFTGRSHVLGGL